jgi:hypothetical protein
VTITAPAAGATLSGIATVSANATDQVGVTGVQFLVDGVATGSEITGTPYSISLDTTAIANGAHALTARARDAAGNSATSATVSVTVNNVAASGDHPRIWLDAPTLARLRASAKAGSAQWTTLQSACNNYVGGTVEAPSGNAYPDLPNIGQGYQGSDYFDPLLNSALCYQVGLGTGDANTTKWGQKGADIATKMASFTSYDTDSGYGIRFYGVGLGLAFDLFYQALSATQKTQIITALTAWFKFYDASGFGRGQSHANYFAGYYAAKAYAGIATEGDNSGAAAVWKDFLDRLHRGGATALTGPEGTHAGVQQFYAKYLVGGGWAEGWGYGPLAVANMTLPSLAAKTAKGIDLIGDSAAPYSYPLDNGAHLMHFLWPGRNLLDDRDGLHEGNTGTSAPSAPSADLYTEVAGMLGRWNHPMAAPFHAYAREVRAKVGPATPWIDFLFWDDKATEQPYTSEPLSYFATGLNAATMRSDWSTTAIWASIRATGYVDNPYSGEQNYDAGGLAIIKGSTPFVVNPGGALVTSFPGLPDTYENAVYDDTYGTGAMNLNNTFHNGTKNQDQFPVDDPSPPRTALSHFEDSGVFVAMRADHLEDVYVSDANVSEWTRDVVYLRPHTFVVYDRTQVGNTSGDQRMHWHVLATPVAATAAAGAVRYDVTNVNAGFLGAVTTVIPASAKVSLVNVVSSSKVYRIEVRPSAQATAQRWLTVFDAAATAGSAAKATSLTSSSNVNGVCLVTAAGNSVVVFGAQSAGTATAGTITFSEPAAATTLVIADLAPNTSYSVSVATGPGHNVTVAPGTGFTSSANGTLSLSVTAAGTVSAN